MNESFQRVIVSPLYASIVNIVVSQVMKDLYEDIIKGNKTHFYLCGPPGTGKSITLYWLYQVFKDSKDFSPVIFPFDSLKSVILVDVTGPTSENLAGLIKLLTRYNEMILVVAFSSSFEIFSLANTRSMTFINEWKRLAKKITFQSLDTTASERFLSSILGRDLNDTDKQMMKLCKGIPRLLAYCYMGISTDVLKQYISQVVLEEFNGVVTYMIKCKDLVDWMNEFNLLMAAKFKSKIQQFNARDPQNTYLFASNLVGIEDDVPFLHFHVDVDTAEYFLNTVRRLWINCKAFTAGVSSASVKGFFFEARIPSIIKDKIEITVKKLKCKTQSDISFNINTTIEHLDALGRDLPSYDILWRAPKGTIGIDYYAKIKGLKLPDDPDTNPKDTLLAMQVSVQVDGHTEKVRASITRISSDLCQNKNIIFMLVNPLWDNFEMLYDDSVSATSGPGASNRFQSLWYGHLIDMSPFKAVEKSLKSIFD